jgi:hypothetical protein
VADRVRIEGGDFFLAVPGAADLYLMRNVLPHPQPAAVARDVG